MADDDSLLLNFAIDATVQAAPKLKIKDVAANLKRGGWKKKRMVAKKIIHKVKKNVTQASSDPQTGEKRKAPPQQSTDNDRPQKKPKDAASTNHANSNDTTYIGKPKAPIPGTKQVLSSIFTSNPDVPTKPVAASTPSLPTPPESEPAQPVFDTTSFRGLGLDPILCNHLTNKLSFKAPTLIQRAALPSLLRLNERDHLLQAQTGSGKTLAFLLPILHRLLVAESEFADKGGEKLKRDLGTLAIVLAPTRELAKQIETVLTSLLKYSGHQQAVNADEEREEDDVEKESHAEHNRNLEASSKHRHWIVAGHIMGGEKKKSEKARLRKGVTILVSTPGRLLDHLKTTQAFEVGNLRWLVLDEADRLLELGFEETLREILQILNQKREAATRSRKRLFVKSWPSTRQTLLCSATIQGGVQKLAEETLNEPELIRAETRREKQRRLKEESADKTNIGTTQNEKKLREDAVTVPTQLTQKYITVPAKLRLVTLVGLVKHLMKSGTPCKIMIFVSSTDSVDFHYHLFANGHKAPTREPDEDPELMDEEEKDSNEDEEEDRAKPSKKRRIEDPALAPPESTLLQTGSETPLLPSALLFKLHGSLPQSARTTAYSNFMKTQQPAVLFCTDVAARGLDMPDVTAIVQYDPPTDVKDYVHRIGRTARLGRKGQAILFLLPSETEYSSILQSKSFNVSETGIDSSLSELIDSPVPKQSRKGRKPYEAAATDLHMSFERFVASSTATLALAESAYKSHVRSYATHTASERHIFHIKKLHLGHVAKSFALREAPTDLVVDKGKRDKEAKQRKEQERRAAKPGMSMYKKGSAMLVASASEFGDGGVKNIISVGVTKRKRGGK